MADDAIAAAQQLQRILQQVQKHFSSEKVRPADAAARAVGAQLGQQFTVYCTATATGATTASTAADDDDEVVGSVFQLLSRPSVHRSIPHSFFHVLSLAVVDQKRKDNEPSSSSLTWFLQLLSQWILSLEEVVLVEQNAISATSTQQQLSGVHESLSACMHAYAVLFAESSLQQADCFCTTLYPRIVAASTRQALVQECTNCVFTSISSSSSPEESIPLLLSPVLAVAVLSLQTAAAERTVTLQHVWRHCWTVTSHGSSADTDTVLALIAWLTKGLNLWIQSVDSNHTTDDGAAAAAAELAVQWLTEVAGLVETVWWQAGNKSVRPVLTMWLQDCLRVTLPRLLAAASSTSCRLSLDSVWHILQRLTDESFLPLDLITCVQLSCWTVTTPVIQDAAGLQQLMTHAVPNHVCTKRMLDNLLTMYVSDASFPKAATLRQQLQVSPLAQSKQANAAHHYSPLLQLLLQDDDATAASSNRELLDLVATTKDFAATNFSAVQQTGALLLGLLLLDDEQHSKSAVTFLTNLLARYPHLGISLLPVVMDRLRVATESNRTGAAVQVWLEFLCRIVQDPHCAQEVWNLVGVECMGPHVPVAVKVSLIRLYPALCVANKRLYRRVLETLRVCITDKQVEIRLAVAATLADMAKEECIRDVKDVIGWIQTLLTVERSSPMDSLLVHFAVASLHHLVVAEELDFEVVIKVLNKRLCPVTDLDAILKLPLVVLEPLVLLLGDGECGQDSEEEEQEDYTVSALSPQVSRAVETLIRLGNALGDQSQMSFETDPTSRKLLSIVKQSIFESLSRYSLHALGVTDDGVREVVASLDNEAKPKLSEAGIRYSSLQILLLDGLETPSSPRRPEEDTALLNLASRLLEYEEELLGASLWQKRGRRKQVETPKTSKVVEQTGKAHLSTLPTPAVIQKLTVGKTSPAAATATLLCADGTQLSVLRDNGDAAIESSDPWFLWGAVQGYLHFAARTVSQEGQDVGKLLTEVSGFLEIFLSPDTIYLALSSLSVYIPHTLCEPEPSQSTYVEEIIDDVVGAYKNQHFQKEEVGKICLGLVGTSSLRFGTTDRIDEIITILEQSIRGYGGQVSFGAYYALALIGQALPQYVQATTSAEVSAKLKRRICRVSGFLIEELLSCFEDSEEVLLDLVACVGSGKATADLVDSISSLDTNSISLLMTKHVAARYLFLSCAYCLPALAAVDGNLLLVVFHLLEAFEWGCGNGIALAPILRACQTSKILETIELERIYADYASEYETRTKGNERTDTDGLEDIFYAINGTSAKPNPYSTRQLLAGNRKLFDDDGSAVALTSCAWALTSSRCIGAESFAVQARLDDTAAQSDVDSILEILSEAAALDDGSKFSGMGIVLMGALSSMRSPIDVDSIASAFPQKDKARVPVPSPLKDTDQAEAAPEESNLATVDFAVLPFPQIGTLLAGVIDLVERSCRLPHLPDDSNSNKRNAALTRTLKALERLSLPGSFAKFFLEPMFQDSDSAPLGCTSLLCSQVRGRRRAVFDGTDFTSLAAQILSTPAESKALDLLGQPLSETLLLENLPGFGSKFAQDALAEAIQNLWQRISPERAASGCNISLFLSGMKELVQSTALSPKSLSIARSFVLGRVFKDLRKLQLATLTNRPTDASVSILDSYVQCIKGIPLSVLDEAKFFKTSESTDDVAGEAVEVMILLELVRQNHFGSTKRERKEVSRILSWFTRMLPASSDPVAFKTLRRVACAFAEATDKDSLATKREQLNTILQNLLMVESNESRLALEWLAVVLAFWCDGRGSDADLSLGYLCTVDPRSVQSLSDSGLEQFVQAMLVDLPFNLTTFCRSNKLSAPVLNHLCRLHKHWSDCAVDADLLARLQECIIYGRSSHTKEDVFVTLATSTLRTNL